MPQLSEELKVQERMTAVGALQVLDAAAGASLDRITQLAAFAFNAPVASAPIKVMAQDEKDGAFTFYLSASSEQE